MITFEDWVENAMNADKKTKIYVAFRGLNGMNVEEHYIKYCFFCYDHYAKPIIEATRIPCELENAFFNEEEAKQYADEINKELENER